MQNRLIGGIFWGSGLQPHPNPKQAATACLSVGENTRWGLAQLMGSPARPKQMYLSCCVAGKTTDLAGEQYGITAALLQHGTREVVASSVSLEDVWGSALSIVTHSLMRQHQMGMKQALSQAQAMVTGQEAPWDDQARDWVLKAWQMRWQEMRPITPVLQEQLLPILVELQKRKSRAMLSDKKMAEDFALMFRSQLLEDTEKPLPHWALRTHDSAKYSQWQMALAQELRSHQGQADHSTLVAMAQKYAASFEQTLEWNTQAPPLIAGSLRFATAVVG